MIVPCTVRKPTWLVLFALGLSPALPLSARGEDPPPPQSNEIKAVVRISRLMIDDVVSRKEVIAAIPYRAKVTGFTCQGVIDGTGKLTTDMTAVENDGVFIINGRGTATTSIRGVRGPIVSTGLAWGPFTTRTPVRFD